MFEKLWEEASTAGTAIPKPLPCAVRNGSSDMWVRPFHESWGLCVVQIPSVSKTRCRHFFPPDTLCRACISLFVQLLTALFRTHFRHENQVPNSPIYNEFHHRSSGLANVWTNTQTDT